MGYELKMFVVRTIDNSTQSKIALKGNSVYDVFTSNDNNTQYYYLYEDKVQVTDEPIIRANLALIVSMFELGKVCLTDDFGICTFEEANGETCSVYAPTDGNQLIGLDSYGDYRKKISLDKVITLIEDLEDRSYVLGAVLSSLRVLRNNDTTKSLYCIFYGH